MCSNMDGSEEPCSKRRGDSTRGSDVLPEGVAAPQSLPCDVDLAQALSLSSCVTLRVSYWYEGSTAQCQCQGFVGEQTGL